RQVARRHARAVRRRGIFQANAALERPVLTHRRAAVLGRALSNRVVTPQRRAAAVRADEREAKEKQDGKRGDRLFREHVSTVNRSLPKSTVWRIKRILKNLSAAEKKIQTGDRERGFDEHEKDGFGQTIQQLFAGVRSRDHDRA